MPDETDRIVETVNTLRAQADYLFTTGGIGPTHDDITADAIAQAFGVPLPENAEAVALLQGRYPGDELNAARRRMARIPEGASLIANPVSVAPGFQIGNVFVLAGVPTIMTGMLEDVGPRLKGGAPVVSRTVRVSGVGEGDIAQPLAAAAKAHRELSLGSYPFFDPAAGRYGSNLVIRGRDGTEVEAVADALVATLREAGVTEITRPD